MSLITFKKALSTFELSSALVSMKWMFLCYAYFWASSVETAHCDFRSDLLPTSNTTILYSACSLSSLYHFSMFAKVCYFVISYTSKAPTAFL